MDRYRPRGTRANPSATVNSIRYISGIFHEKTLTGILPGIILEYSTCRHSEFAISVYSLPYTLQWYCFVPVQCLRVEASLPWPGMFVVPANLDRYHLFTAAGQMCTGTWPKSARCKASTVKKVNIIARAGDVIAGGAGGIEQCPSSQHQPPGNCYITHIYMTYS